MGGGLLLRDRVRETDILTDSRTRCTCLSRSSIAFSPPGSPGSKLTVTVIVTEISEITVYTGL